MEWLRWQKNPWGQEILQGLAWMWVTRQDVRDGWRALPQIVGLPQPEPGKPGKNPLENKLFHPLTSIATLATVGRSGHDAVSR